ncbi:hypothetical protein QVD17_24994 [Tagetes erecta]|uniref:Uncharacterized protein n=1 Tax=Tagetes erecta TaxID=13708 RepID=A0AAD8KII8_TARER|nr:hypothetical protein QVD17_24994 [Tagetes erecta]
MTIFSRTVKSYVVSARRGSNDRGNIVDENMIVLRMRIKDVEMEEMGGLLPAVSENWMEWEKMYYADYIRDVCEAMMGLQMCLMNARPSFALGTLILLMLSVPISTSVLIYNIIRLYNLFL